jgi:hypothetical protein
MEKAVHKGCNDALHSSGNIADKCVVSFLVFMA